jgi:hypothetical protein
MVCEYLHKEECESPIIRNHFTFYGIKSYCAIHQKMEHLCCDMAIAIFFFHIIHIHIKQLRKYHAKLRHSIEPPDLHMNTICHM